MLHDWPWYFLNPPFLYSTGTSHRRTQYSNTTELMVRLDNLRPYTEYEFSVMLTKGSKSSQYSLSIRNTTQEDGRFDTYLYCALLLFKWRPYWQFESLKLSYGYFIKCKFIGYYDYKAPNNLVVTISSRLMVYFATSIWKMWWEKSSLCNLSLPLWYHSRILHFQYPYWKMEEC